MQQAVSEVMPIMVRAIQAGMAVIKRGQRGDVGAVVTKQGDGQNTVVTKWDKLSEAAMLEVLKEAPYNLQSEEIGFVPNAKGRESFVFLVDPLDGSKPFAIGAPTSTLSVALYDLGRQTVVSCVVGEPATGRIMLAEEGFGTRVFYSDMTPSNLANTVKTSVWTGPLGAGSVVLVDCYHGFQLKDHPVTPNENWGRLMTELNNIGITYAMGTNCGHLAYVALGRNSVVASITTCRGGPHDITPGLLVSEAGGVVRSFSNRDGTLREVPPLAVMDANFMVAANNVETSNRLVEIFTKCVTGN